MPSILICNFPDWVAHNLGKRRSELLLKENIGLLIEPTAKNIMKAKTSNLSVSLGCFKDGGPNEEQDGKMFILYDKFDQHNALKTENTVATLD